MNKKNKKEPNRLAYQPAATGGKKHNRRHKLKGQSVIGIGSFRVVPSTIGIQKQKNCGSDTCDVAKRLILNMKTVKHNNLCCFFIPVLSRQRWRATAPSAGFVSKRIIKIIFHQSRLSYQVIYLIIIRIAIAKPLHESKPGRRQSFASANRPQ